MTPQNRAIVELHNVCKSFARPSGEPLAVLTDINLSLQDGEILGLVGRSGSGKSTLLRIAGGLIEPNSGEVLYCGMPLKGPSEGIGVVFQTFALFPWLNVIENVELGLDACGVPIEEARRRAMSAIDLIGLDGFQSAYPRELSGGMRQRVGFARAFVLRPIVLLMDEPFSALDVLTAERLRTDFLDLWTQHQLPTKSVLLVTHNIEEAVIMCDRILVLSSQPGRIAAEIKVQLPHPRNRFDQRFHEIVDELYSVLTERAVASMGSEGQIRGGFVHPLPPLGVNHLIGFVETLMSAQYNGQAQLGRIAHSPSLVAKDVLAMTEVLHILAFAELKDGAVKLTTAGQLFAEAGAEERKVLFREHLLRFVPFAAHILQVLNEREGHAAPRIRFKSELEDHLSSSDAERTLQTIIRWGRYSEIFTYDDEKRLFCLDHRATQ